MRRFRYGSLAVLFAVAACGGSERTRKSPPIQQVSLNALEIALAVSVAEVGVATKASAMGTYADGSSRDVSTQVAWTSDDVGVATIAADGTITPVAVGLATINAALLGQTASTQITVTPAGDAIVALSLTPSPASVEIGSTVQLELQVVFQSGMQLAVTQAAQWTTTDATIATVDAGVVTGLGAGVAVINASYGGMVQSAGLTVREPIVLSSIELSDSTLSLGLNATQQLTATGILTDGTRMDVTAMVAWTSSNPSVAMVSATGLVTTLTAGEATITAMLSNVTATALVTAAACSYPQSAGRVVLGGVLPAMSWVGGFEQNGTTADFSLEEFYCSPQYANYSSIHFIIGAGWCPNCPDFKRRVEGQIPAVQQAGGLMMWVEIENDQSRPATHSEARQIVNRTVPNAPGLRVGDGETRPTASLFSRAVSAVPGAFVVRKSDMMVIADQGQSGTYLDFGALAREAANGGGNPTGNCSMSDEESYEPNDQPGQAGTLTVPADVMGGVCNAESDFYRIQTTGPWTVNLTFSHATGDLDIYVIDESTGMIMTDGTGARIGSESTTDNESFSHDGNALIVVSGYQGATAPYQLTVR